MEIKMKIIEFLETINNHYIIGIVEDIGEGKSITGVSIISMLRILSKVTNSPLNVASNIPLRYPHKFIKYYDELDNLYNSLIFIDEIHLIADSRKSHGTSNFFTSGVTMKVRKTDSQMIWTSQETSQVEMRVRNRTTLFINPVKVSPRSDDLCFQVNLVSKNRKKIGDIILNLDAWKDDYDTRYIPLQLLNREDDK